MRRKKRRCRLNWGAPENSFSFSLFVSFCVGPIWPHVLHQVCVSFIPLLFNPPLHIYTPAARNEWFTWRGSLPPSESYCNYTQQPSLGFSDLTVLCNAWKTLAFSYLFLFSTVSLALSLSYIQYWLFMLFNVAERARGLRMGEKRSSWHTYAPVVNSSSQHSSKYTDLLLFPLPPSSVSFASSLFLQLGACLIISTPCCSTPKITLWKIKMLRCSSKIFTQ